MKRALGLLLLTSACATTPTTPTPAPTAPPPAPTVTACAKEAPKSTADDATKWLGAKIEKVCLINTSEDGYLKLHEVVAPTEGQPFTLALVSRDLRELVLPGTVRDARAFAEPLPSGGVKLTYVVTEYPLVGKVSFEGATTVSVDLLRDLALRTAYSNPQALRRLTDSMTELYLDRGYSHAKVTPRLAPPADGKTDVTFVVEEGARTTIGTIRFVGNKRLTAADLKKVLRSVENGPYLETQTTYDEALLSALYFDKGMVNVRITTAVAPGSKAPDALELTFTIAEGEVFKLGTLSLKGHSLGEEKAVLKTLEVKPGSVFSRAALQRDMERLKERALKQGAKIEVVPVTNVDVDKKRIDVVLDVEKQPGGPIQF